MSKVMFAILLFSSAFTHALEFKTEPRPMSKVTLMKCYSRSLGTMWVSFGHLIRTGSDEIQTFPTEIVIFKDESLSAVRKIYSDFNEALAVKISDTGVGVSLEFEIQSGIKHRLKILRIDSQAPESFVGAWSIHEVTDQVACTTGS